MLPSLGTDRFICSRELLLYFRYRIYPLRGFLVSTDIVLYDNHILVSFSQKQPRLIVLSDVRYGEIPSHF